MAKVRIKKSTLTENPPTGYTDIFVDDVDNITKVRKEDGTIKPLEDTDVLVGATAADTTPGYLDDKIAAGPGTSKQVINPGANEQVEISADVLTVHGRTGDVVSAASDYDADQIDYDNTTSGLAATDTQAAIDEVKALFDSTDEASEISYDNSGSGLAATNVQDAIDEVEGRVDTVETTLSSHLDGGANKHDATEIDYERADGSKVDIQAGSDDLETAVSDLDDSKLSIDGNNAMNADLDMGANNIANVGTVDGRDVSADGTKLDTIETNAKDDQDADEVPYDDTNTSLGVSDVQAAIEALKKEFFQANQQTFQNTITTPVVLVNDVASNNSNVSVFSYNTTTGVLTVNKTSSFKFTWTITLDTVDNSRQTGLLRFQRFNGVSFVDIPSAEGPSLAYTYNRNNASGEDSATLTCILSVTSGQQFRATVECPTNNAVRTVALGTNLVVEEK